MGGGYGQFENSEGGTLTVSARVSNGSSRHAMPSMPALVYAALLYKDGEILANPPHKDFVTGATTENAGKTKLNFSFQRPDDTSGTFTLEIFAFVKTEGGAEDDTMQFSREAALLSGNKTGLSIVGDTIEINEAIPLSSSKPGTVSLKIKVPEGCSLVIDDARFSVMGDSLDFTLTQNGDGISAGAYQVTFTVKKDDEIVHIFSEYINVINGLCTDTWWNGEKSSAVKDVASSISKTVYVRGAGGYYDTNSPYNQDGNAMSDDEHTGSFLSPLATIQKAIDKIIAINDGASAYTICVDGTLTVTDTTYIGTNGMADFSALSQNLNLTIKALSATATLDGGARFDADGNIANAGGIRKRVIQAKPASGTLNLTLENLTITGGCQNSGYGGGIYVRSPGGELKISNGTTICRNKATRGGGVYIYNSRAFTMTGGEISDNIATGDGGGAVYVVNATFDMSGGTISNCKTTSTSSSSGGGGIYNDAGTLIISGGTISDCVAAINGGGIYNNVSDASIVSTIKNCEISGCKATGTATAYGFGGGIYNASGTLELTDVTITGENNIDNPDARYGGGIYNKGSLTITGGKISNCTSNIGGGVYNSAGTLKITDGTISENNASKNGGGVYVIGSGSSFTMNGGEISNNKAEDAYGGGIYIEKCTFTMSDGTISGNTASEAGGGVYTSGSDCAFTMESGTINNNTVNKYSGGGVAVTNASTFTMKSGTISGNTVKLNSNNMSSYGGGGVYTVYKSTFIMEDGTISNNKALGGNGGGVFCLSENDKFEMKGGSISENTADGDGGGVYVNRGSAFTMSGGTISGNNASNGNGAYLVATVTDTGKLNMSGAAQFAESDDVYLSDYNTNISTITVVGALTAASPVATITPSYYTAGRQVLSAGTDMTIDDTVCDKFALTPAPDGMEWKIVPNDDGTAGALGIESVFLDSSSGDDANSGLTASKALKTLSKAIELFESQNAKKIMICAEYTLPSGESTLLDRMGGG